MQKNKNNLNELKQKLNMVIRTFYNLNGINPSAVDLYHQLGNEYTFLIEEYSLMSGAQPA